RKNAALCIKGLRSAVGKIVLGRLLLQTPALEALLVPVNPDADGRHWTTGNFVEVLGGNRVFKSGNEEGASLGSDLDFNVLIDVPESILKKFPDLEINLKKELDKQLTVFD
ncbi:MAG: hypothetical protein ACI9BD_000369, partial [Candidatus Marinamargulisbacteria bacterium]